MTTKKNLSFVLGIFLLACFIAVVFLKKPFLSILNEKEVAKYYSLLKDHNKNLSPSILAPGDEAKIKLPFPHKSIQGIYALSNTKFVPDDNALTPWVGKDKPREWSGHLTGKMKKIRLSVSFIIPDNSELAGKTIKGDLLTEVIYPKTVKSSKLKGIIPGKFSNRKSPIRKQIFCHVFSLKQKQFLKHTGRWMNKTWIVAMLVSGTLTSIFLSGFLGLQNLPQGSAIALVPFSVSAGGYLWFTTVSYLFRFLEGIPFNFWTFLIGVPLVICIPIGFALTVVVFWFLLSAIVRKSFGCIIKFK